MRSLTPDVQRIGAAFDIDAWDEVSYDEPDRSSSSTGAWPMAGRASEAEQGILTLDYRLEPH